MAPLPLSINVSVAVCVSVNTDIIVHYTTPEYMSVLTIKCM